MPFLCPAALHQFYNDVTFSAILKYLEIQIFTNRTLAADGTFQNIPQLVFYHSGSLFFPTLIYPSAGFLSLPSSISSSHSVKNACAEIVAAIR